TSSSRFGGEASSRGATGFPQLASVAGRDAAREVELPYRALGAVADCLVEAVLRGIEAQKRAPARLEPIGLGVTLDAPQHEAEANESRWRDQTPFFAPSGKFRSRPALKTPDPRTRRPTDLTSATYS